MIFVFPVYQTTGNMTRVLIECLYKENVTKREYIERECKVGQYNVREYNERNRKKDSTRRKGHKDYLWKLQIQFWII